MSHVTIYQAEKLRELGFPQKEPHQRTLYGRYKSVYTPSAEELMEWLKEEGWHYHIIGDGGCGWTFETVNEPVYFEANSDKLIDVLFQAACWVLEGKK